MYVIDTNVVLEFIKPKPDAGVMAWLVSAPRKALFLPSVVIAELYFGIELLPRGKKRDALREFTDSFIAQGGLDGILPFAAEEAHAYAKIGAHRSRIGRPLKQLDGQIAAIATVRNLPVVTRNVRDFEHCGINVINPWDRP